MNENEINSNSLKLKEIKKKYEQIEIKLHKSEIENTKKNKEIQRLQNELQKFRKLTNDASTDYPWPERDISDKNNDNNINKSDSKKEKSDLIAKKQIYKKFKGTGNSCLIGNSNYHTIKSIIEKNSPIKDDMHINQKNQEKTKLILKNKINRHRTSLNITKKNYIMKPKEFKLNQEKNNINYPNNKIHIEENYNINNAVMNISRSSF